MDLVVHNPFNTEVNLSELTATVTTLPSGSKWSPELVDVETLDEIILDPKETRTVNIVSLFNHLAQANLLDLRSHYRFWQDGQRLCRSPMSHTCSFLSSLRWNP